MIRRCNGIYFFLLVISFLIEQNNAIRPILRSEIQDLMADAAVNTTSDDNNNLEEQVDDKYPDVEELFLKQDLDHIYGSQKNQTFQQRYFYSSRYVHKKKKASNGTNLRSDHPKTEAKRETYAFICTGGEGPSMDKSVLVDSVHCTGDMLELASILFKERGADVHVFALEHRYYGKSYPVFADGSSPVENKNLVYLSSRQALLDVKHFVCFATIHHLNMLMVRWVAFGGSYPGMLAAWSRLEMPHLIFAAVSNSAPVQATVDMYQYNDYVSHILKDKSIGGSDQCLHIIEKGHQDIGNALSKMHEPNFSYPEIFLSEFATLFNICDSHSLKVVKNVENFLSESVIDIPMQSNDPSCKEKNCNIQKLCKTVLEKSLTLSPMHVLAEIRSSQRDECDNIEWKDQLKFLSSPKAQKGGTRSWLWQTCNEFGFYQTCELGSHCPFSKGFHRLSQDFEICKVAFGITPVQVQTNVNNTLNHYNGWNMNATRIFNVNGDVDPWSTLAITIDHGTQKLPNLMVKGASHHFWTHQVKKSDTESVKNARQKIHQQVIAWLDEKKGDSTNVYSVN